MNGTNDARAQRSAQEQQRAQTIHGHELARQRWATEQ
jgi:hypothetical protein